MISIIVPIYNCEKYLTQCLDSIQNQTYKDIEIILVNDGSTDKSGDICDLYAQKDNRFKAIHQENKGLSGARNSGMKIAKGEYITFIDSDDWIDSDMLEILLHLLMDKNADVSICNFVIEKQKPKTKKDLKEFEEKNNQTTSIFNEKEAISKLIINKEIQDYAWGKLYKKELFNGIEYPERTYYEDIYVTYKVFSNAKKIVKKNTIKLHYRQHEDSITSKQTVTIKKELDYIHSLNNLYDFISQNPDKITKEEYDEVYTRLTRRIYGAKKESIRNFYHSKENFTKVSEVITPTLKKILPKAKISKIGFFRYIGVLLSIHLPILFSFKK